MPKTRKSSEAGSSCDITGRPASSDGKKQNRTAFYRHQGDFSWSGVSDEPYKPVAGGWEGIIRRVLVGRRGESAKFHLRYFEIFPGGNSSFERHRHEHVVICARGRGVVRTGRSRRTMDFLDTIYIAPDTPHELSNPFPEPFGFFCIVNAKRDRPKILKR